MKSIKALLLISFIAFGAVAFSQSNSLVYIHMQENLAASGMVKVDSYMHITFPDGQTKRIDLVKLDAKGTGAAENGKKIQQELTALYNEGYEVVSASNGGDSYTVTTKIIMKKD